MSLDKANRALNRDGWLKVFHDFDIALVERVLDQIELLIIGGAAMALAHGERSTTDVDVVSDHLPDQYRLAAQSVAEAHNIRADWLNDGAKGFAPLLQSEPHTEVFAGQRLHVFTPPASYLLATKLHASREQDLPDVYQLMRVSGLTTVRELWTLVTAAYPASTLPARTQYFVEVAATEFLQSSNPATD